MRFLKTLLLVALALLIQSVIFSRFGFLRGVDLFLLLNIYCGLNFSPMYCLAVAVTSGLVQDTFSTGILGFNAFSKATIGYSLAILSSRLMIKQTFVILFLIAVYSVFDLFVLQWLQRIFSLAPAEISFRTILSAGISNVIAGTVLFAIADKLRASREYDRTR